MKLLLTFRWLIAVPVLFCFSACLKDQCQETFRIHIPVYKSLTAVRADMKSEAPRVIQYPGKIFTIGQYIFVNEIDRGIHIIDNSNPSAPKNISFINIPGNMDMSVQNNTLYADSYGDLVAMDVTDVNNVIAKKFVSNVFPDRNIYYYNSTNPDSIKVVVDFLVKDTVVDCQTFRYMSSCSSCAYAMDTRAAMSAAGGQKSGKGGSMARFTILKNHLYTVTRSDLRVFSLSQPFDPQLLTTRAIGNWNIETIFPFINKLFIGSTNGMFIFDVTDPGSPNMTGQFAHVQSCDPVIADEHYAYVTLRNGTICTGTVNQLDVIDIRTATPSLVKTYPLTNPHGLSKENNTLLVCEGASGLKVFDATNVLSIKQVAHLKNIDAYDVITNGNLALVVGKDGLYQYDITDRKDIKKVSRIPVHN
jgi:hypothetical protein